MGGAVAQQWRANHREVAVPTVVPRGVSTGDDGWSGIEVSQGPVTIEVYLDFLCPSCRRLEGEIAGLLRRLGDSGQARIVYHPVGMLDSYSSPAGYSTRAAAAAGCAADQGRFVPFAASLFARQPPERGPGLSDDDLVAAAVAAGSRAEPFRACLAEQRYRPWASSVTQHAYRDGVVGTPTLLVAGKRLDIAEAGMAERLERAVRDAESR